MCVRGQELPPLNITRLKLVQVDTLININQPLSLCVCVYACVSVGIIVCACMHVSGCNVCMYVCVWV